MADNIKNTDVDFDKTMERLEKITEELGAQSISLEYALKLYEEGVALVRACNKMLEETERKIKILQISDDGELVESDFTGATTEI